MNSMSSSNLVNEFVSRILKGESSFTVENTNSYSDKYFHFMTSNIGKAKYVYGKKGYYNVEELSRVNLKPELVAIVSDGVVYIHDNHFFGLSYNNDVELPVKTQYFNLFLNETNEYVKKEIFPKFYAELSTKEITDKYQVENIRDNARSTLFSNNPTIKEQGLEPMFNVDDVANILCGYMNVNEEANERLDKKKESWIYIKSKNEKIKEFMESSDIVKDYELEIAQVLRNTDAKNVNVEFELNGKKDTIKIEPNVIIRNMNNNQNFSDYNFSVSTTDGKKFLKNLGACDYKRDGYDVLTCENISKITYGKKELYVKKNLVQDNSNEYSDLLESKKLTKDNSISMTL